MIRGFLVCGAALALGLLVSACAVGPLSEAEQQSMAAAATAPQSLSRAIRLQLPYMGKTSSAVNTDLIRVVKSHCLLPEPWRRRA